MSTSKTIVVDRQKWLNGNVMNAGKKAKKLPGSQLYSEASGKKCCLGFAVEQSCGISLKGLPSYSTPVCFGYDFPQHRDSLGDYIRVVGEWEGLVTFTDSPISLLAMSINDNPDLKWVDRETLLLQAFRLANLDISFEGPIPSDEELEAEARANVNLPSVAPQSLDIRIPADVTEA